MTGYDFMNVISTMFALLGVAGTCYVSEKIKILVSVGTIVTLRVDS